MGGIKVDADSQMTTMPGLFAAGECAAGLHGANRLGGNSLSDLLVFGKRAGEFAAKFALENGVVAVDTGQLNAVIEQALIPFERESKGENPFQIQNDLQEVMQKLVGIVRTDRELQEATVEIRKLKERCERVGCTGNRGYNPGWHTALELKHMLTVAEAIALAARERKESRGGHFREDYPEKSGEFGKVNISIKQNQAREMEIRQVPKPSIREDLKRLIDEMK
jgi:succinate dehydrogenase / fumarate reductase flavoprotein subunit